MMLTLYFMRLLYLESCLYITCPPALWNHLTWDLNLNLLMFFSYWGSFSHAVCWNIISAFCLSSVWPACCFNVIHHKPNIKMLLCTVAQRDMSLSFWVQLCSRFVTHAVSGECFFFFPLLQSPVLTISVTNLDCGPWLKFLHKCSKMNWILWIFKEDFQHHTMYLILH